MSDVHFGCHDPAIVAAIEALLLERRPELVVISGDFTQRARRAQFLQAAAFVDRLEAGGLNVLAVPGNHDVPLYDVIRRFMWPLTRYRRYIDPDLCPYFENDDLAVLGINTARSLTFKDGRINHEQMRRIRDTFRRVPPGKTRILVTHHPLFAMPIDGEGMLSEAVGRHEDALEAVTEAGVHILLAGHFHRSYANSARAMVDKAGPALIIQAGTATSTRVRGGERQSFNTIEATNRTVELRVESWNGSLFVESKPVRFVLEAENWRIIRT